MGRPRIITVQRQPSHVGFGIITVLFLSVLLLITPGVSEATTRLSRTKLLSNSIDSENNGADASSSRSSSFTPGFEGKCFSDSSESSSAGHLPFFVQEYFTCLTPGLLQPNKALVADADGNINIEAVQVTELLTVSDLTNGVTTLSRGSMEGLLSIVPGNQGTRHRHLLQSNTLSIVGGLDVDEFLTASSVTVDGQLMGGILTDGVATISSGNFSTSGFVSAVTLTDGTVLISGGNVSTPGTVTIGHTDADAVTVITDGDVTASGAVTVGSHDSGKVVITEGSVTASAALAGEMITDGTLTVSGGNLTTTGTITAMRVVITSGEAEQVTLTESITANGTIEGKTFTDGVLIIFNGDLSTSGSVTANSAVLSGHLSAKTVTATNIISYGATSVGNKITVSSGGADITGATTLSDKLTVIGGGADITGPTTLSDKLTVIGGGADITGTTTLSDKLTVIGGGADITGTTTLSDKLTVTSGGIDLTTGVATGPGWGLNFAAFKPVSSDFTVLMSDNNGNILSVSGGPVTISFSSTEIGVADVFVSQEMTDGDLVISCSTYTMVGGVLDLATGNTTVIKGKRDLTITNPGGGSMLKVIVDGNRCFVTGTVIGDVSAT